MQAEIKSIFKRMDEQLALSKAVYELAGEIKVMGERIKSLGEGQIRLQQDVEELKATPRRRMDTVIAAFIGAIATALVAYVFFRLGLRP